MGADAESQHQSFGRAGHPWFVCHGQLYSFHHLLSCTSLPPRRVNECRGLQGSTGGLGIPFHGLGVLWTDWRNEMCFSRTKFLSLVTVAGGVVWYGLATKERETSGSRGKADGYERIVDVDNVNIEPI